MPTTTPDAPKRLVYDVLYLDGRHETIPVRPKHIYEVEQMGLASDTDKAYHLLFFAAGRPGEFKEFVDSLDWMTTREVALPPLNGSKPTT